MSKTIYTLFLITSYTEAVVFCFITMLCWGSWPVTQKFTEKTWRFEFFYIDFVFGMAVFTFIAAVTLGSTGASGRDFFLDWTQADPASFRNAMLSGALFNLANILFVGAITYSGMSVAFPIGVGLALVTGITVNYNAGEGISGSFLFSGAAAIVVAIGLSALASSLYTAGTGKANAKGIGLAIVAGLLFGSFYKFLAMSMVTDFVNPEIGLITPYTALVCFAAGVLLSNIPLNGVLLKRPLQGEPLRVKGYFAGNRRNHLLGLLGGMIWAVGLSFNILSADQAGFAISFGLSQGNAMIAALLGVFVWQEFKGARASVRIMLGLMFFFYFLGLMLIVASH